MSDLVPRLDANLDGSVSAEEVSASRAAMEQAIVNGSKVATAGGACRGMLEGARLVEGDGLEISAQWVCPPGSAVSVQLDFLGSLSRGHRHLLTLVDATAGAPSFAYREEPRFSLVAAHTIPRVGWAERFRLARTGFIAALPVAAILFLLLGFGGDARDLRFAAVAFALAAGAGCVIASRGSFAPRLVAPGAAIALLFTGIEGFCAPSARGRWAAALAVGAASGVWIAQRIADVAMPVRERPLAVLPFALGAVALLLVLGQLSPLAFARLSRHEFWPRRVTPTLAALAVVAGGGYLLRLL